MGEHESKRNPDVSDKALLLAAPVATARITNAHLLAGANELIIEHQGRENRLRLTQKGKLILTA